MRTGCSFVAAIKTNPPAMHTFLKKLVLRLDRSLQSVLLQIGGSTVELHYRTEGSTRSRRC
jgi:hypothetical protein